MPTIDGRVKLTIPEGTQPGSVFRLRGKGIPYLQSKGGGRGDQFVTITITVPKNMTAEQKERLHAYAESMNEAVSEPTQRHLRQQEKALSARTYRLHSAHKAHINSKKASHGVAAAGFFLAS